MSENIYSNLLSIINVVIPSGQTQSSIVNCAQLSNGHGCSALRGIKVSSGFPDCNLSFLSLDSLADVNPAPLKLFDGVNKLDLSIPMEGTLEKIGLPVIPFDAETYFILVTSVATDSDQTVSLYFQPIYQGAA